MKKASATCLALLVSLTVASSRNRLLAKDTAGASPSLPPLPFLAEWTLRALNKGSQRGSAPQAVYTELHQAASNGDAERVKRLLAEKHDVNAGPDGDTPLHCAAQNARGASHAKCIELLLKAGADVNARTTLHGLTPLQLSLNRGRDDQRLDVVRQLLAAKADVNLADDEGTTPLQLACGSDSPHAAQLLIDAGAKVDALDRHGETALRNTMQVLEEARRRIGQKDETPEKIAEFMQRRAGQMMEGKVFLRQP